MTLVLLCSWSSILIFVLLIKTKYRWTAPPYKYLLLFLFAGANSVIPADLTNKFLSRETDFWFFSPDRWEAVRGFLIGPGMGEELFKMTAGLLVLLILGICSVRLNAAGRFLGFTTVGLTFATLENLLAYSGLEFWTMITRGLLAVPLHATMSMIHAAAVNRAANKSSFLPLLNGYLITVVLHWVYDAMSLYLPGIDPRLYLYPFVSVLLVWGFRYWLSLPERDPQPTEDSNQSLSYG